MGFGVLLAVKRRIKSDDWPTGFESAGKQARDWECYFKMIAFISWADQMAVEQSLMCTLFMLLFSHPPTNADCVRKPVQLSMVRYSCNSNSWHLQLSEQENLFEKASLGSLATCQLVVCSRKSCKACFGLLLQLCKSKIALLVTGNGPGSRTSGVQIHFNPLIRERSSEAGSIVLDI